MDAATDRVESLDNLAQRDGILAAVGEAATAFMLAGDLDGRIADLLRELGQATNACRVYIFEHHTGPEGAALISQRHEWARDGVSPQIGNTDLQNLPCDAPSFARVAAVLSTGEAIQGNLEAFTPEEQAVLEPQNIKSLLLVPIFIHTDWWGFAGFDACREPRVWSAYEIWALRIATGLIGASLSRQKAEEEMRQSEERFRVLLDSMPAVAVQGYGPDGLVRYWNKASESIYGYTSEEAVGKSLLDLIIPPDMRSFVQEAIRVGAETGVMPPAGEHLLMRRDGSRVAVFSSHAVISLSGRPRELFCIDVDLSPLKAVENELRRREREFSDMAEHSPDIIMRYDRQFRHVYVNSAVTKVVDIPPELWIGKTHAEIGFPSALCRYWEEGIRSVFDSGLTRRDEFEIPARNGTAVIDWQLIPERDGKGEVATVLAVSRDVTTIKRAEQELRDNAEELRRLRAHAEHVREDEQRRITRRSHGDFGQRLTTLTMNLTGLRDFVCSGNGEAQARIASDLESIKELLTLARDISMELRPSVLDHFGFPAALEWAAERLETSTGLDVETDIDEDARLDASAESGMYRIVQELLTNTARHARATAVRVSLEKSDGHVTLTVCDNGVGMPEDALLSGRTMGLLAVRETAQSIGGVLSVAGEPGAGTRVTVDVPLEKNGKDRE